MKKTLIIIGVVMLMGITTFFLGRNLLLKYIIGGAQQKVAHNYGASLIVSNPTFKGFFDLNIKSFVFLTPNADTLLKADNVALSPRLSDLVTLSARFSKINVENIALQLKKDTSGFNFAFLFKRKKGNDSILNVKQSYNLMFNKLFNAVFSYVPDELFIQKLSARYSERLDTLKFEMPDAIFKKGDINLKLNVYNSYNKISCWNIGGNIDKQNKILWLKVASDSTNLTSALPYIDRQYGCFISFDTAYFAINSHSFKNKIFSIAGDARLVGLIVNHPKLSSNKVLVKKADFNYTFHFGNDFTEVDSSSTANITSIHLNPYVRWQPEPLQKLAISFKLEASDANAFFSSLPEGMFDNVHGLKADGKLSYSFMFNGELKNPENLYFSSSMHKVGFKIKHFGDEDLTKMNNSFSYTAYEKGIPVKTFTVGPENPDFTQLWQIPSYLRDALLNSEDGGFFAHRGFNEDAFRESIIENIQKGKFARGGSTITMQLVKNVFLSRNKTIARKAEEALIVWLIENNGLCSKARMYEVYLNIIEWGPRIYGIKEAAHFYFLKQPMQLTLAECIFLASIVPKPKWFMYSFDVLGNLRPDLAGYYRIISGIMLRKGQITQAEYDALQPNVKLKGPAQFYLKNMLVAPTENIEEE